MDELDELKNIIDEKLSHIEVTKKLERNTLKAIHQKEENLLSRLRRNWMQLTTVFSIFMIVLVLGINHFNRNDTPGTVPQSPQVTNCNPRADSYQYADGPNTITEDTDQCPVNP